MTQNFYALVLKYLEGKVPAYVFITMCFITLNPYCYYSDRTESASFKNILYQTKMSQNDMRNRLLVKYYFIFSSQERITVLALLRMYSLLLNYAI